MATYNWTACQLAASQAFTSLYVSPAQQVLVVDGFGGTGKTTVLQHFLSEIPKLRKTRQLITGDCPDYEILITATTNKAAEQLRDTLGPTEYPISTTASALGLILRGYGRTARLQPTKGSGWLRDTILVIDEASFLDDWTLQLVLDALDSNSKVVLMGDPRQLLCPGSYVPVAFNQGFPTVQLTELVRFKPGSHLDQLSACFRNMVDGGQLFNFVPDGDEVIWLPRDKFEQAVVDEFTRSDWKPADSRVLCWRNKAVNSYNQGLFGMRTGQTELKENDMVVCNSHLPPPKGSSEKAVKTDRIVTITRVLERDCIDGLSGRFYRISGRHTPVFLPDSWEEAKRQKETYLRANNKSAYHRAEGSWADLRPLFASTVDKSQGSTFDTVFIDFDDIACCPHIGQLARMGYVATSRARKRIYITGDL